MNSNGNGGYKEYEYDNKGNITQVDEYSLTGSLGKNTSYHTVKEYSYDDSNWGDKLTEYDDQTLTYDNIGNPLTYRDGMTMQWRAGRQLYKINTGDDTVKFSYNADGLRTSKENSEGTSYYYYDNNNNMIAQKKNNSIMYFQYDSEGNVVSMTFEGSRYYYVKNQQGDIEKIVNHSGNVVVTYKYNAWGKLCGMTDTSGQWSIGTMNPFRYRGYIYDDETGLYYLKSRYFDPITGRFINSDCVDYIGATKTALSINLFSYCENSSIACTDKSGHVIETVIDIASAIWSLADLIMEPSWLNLGFFVWDVVAAIAPFVPGSYVAKGGKLVVKVASKVDDFAKSEKYLTGAYKALRKVFKGKKGIEIHHLVEKRFKTLFKSVKNVNDYLSVPISKKLHKKITKRWRKVFPYGMDYTKIKKADMEKAIKKVYKDMPQLQKETLKWFRKNWKKK